MIEDKSGNAAVILANTTVIGSTLGCLCWAVQASAARLAELKEEDLGAIRETLEAVIRTEEWRRLNSVLKAVNENVVVRRPGRNAQGGEPCQK